MRWAVAELLAAALGADRIGQHRHPGIRHNMPPAAAPRPLPRPSRSETAQPPPQCLVHSRSASRPNRRRNTRSPSAGPRRPTGPGGAVALGSGTISNNVNTVAIGVNASATNAGASALGTFAVASGGNSTRRRCQFLGQRRHVRSPEAGGPRPPGRAPSRSGARQSRRDWTRRPRYQC